MPREIAAVTLQYLLAQGSALALIDVREHGEYNLAHIPGASSVPRRLIEFRIPRLVPHTGTQVVVCDDRGPRAHLAARTLERMGYTRVAVLDGGINRWAAEGLPTEWGMNVPSKDFGEKVEVVHHVPTITADELRRRQQAGEDLLILDTRTPEEYQRFCIPGGRSMPGAELALRITDVLRERPGAAVVVNCAGRTRSIIGARVLQRMGIPAVSLRNGTSGWVLAGYELERGGNRLTLPDPSPEGRAAAEAYAARLAEEDGVRRISVTELQALMQRAEREPVYRIDVRTDAEFQQGHIPGFWHFPGGQAVQRVDDVVAVRSAPIVFCCDGMVRATVTASWYRQMGFPNVYAVDGGTAAWLAAGLALEQGTAPAPNPLLDEARSKVRTLAPRALAEAPPALTLFVDTSDAFAAGHVRGAHWRSRSRLELGIEALAPERSARIVVTDRDGEQALLAAMALHEMGYAHVTALEGGMEAWRTEGLPVEQGLAGIMSPPDDVVPFGPDRSSADMINYLRWEERLGHKYAGGARASRKPPGVEASAPSLT